MLTPKVNKKKNIVSYVLLAIIMLVISAVIYSNFFKGKSDIKENIVVPGLGSTNIEIIPEQKISKPNFELNVMDDKKFLNLVEFKYEQTPMEDIKVGKDDPFEVDELIEIANGKRRR